jgi:hypothetical protein
MVPTVLLPYEISVDSQTLRLHAQPALAKDAGKGGGNGNGNANGQGGGNGNANGQGGANGNGNAGSQGAANGNGNAGAQSGASGNPGNSSNVTGGNVNRSAAESRESVEIGAPAREVHHANGMMEAIVDGRYVMKDAKGRTIINRKAIPSDQLRLQSFAP